MFSTAVARISGVKSISSSGIRRPGRPYAGGLLGIGCVGAYHSPGTSPGGTAVSLIGQMGSPVTRSNTYRKVCLVGCATSLRIRPSTITSSRIGADEMS